MDNFIQWYKDSIPEKIKQYDFMKGFVDDLSDY